MPLPTKARVRSADANDLPQIANLIHFETYVHRHLDYRPPLDWYGTQPFLVLEEGEKARGVLVCPPDPPQVAWIRLFAAATRQRLLETWQALWEHARALLRTQPTVRWMAAIPLQGWFCNLLEKSGFTLRERIVLLAWEVQHLPSTPQQPSIHLRSLTPDDIEAVQRIDHVAFHPFWQNSADHLALALKQATHALIAEVDGEAVAYQISTATPMGGHIARLAVVPPFQGQGIGAALLRSALIHFSQRGARRVTVNTQEDNHTSLALYRRLGFEPTGETYPVYEFTLAQSIPAVGKDSTDENI